MNNIKETLKQDLTNDKAEQLIENVEEIEEGIVQESKKNNEENQEINKTENVIILEQNEAIVENKEDEEPSNEINRKAKGDFLHKYAIVITIISVLLFIGLIVFSTIFALINRNSNKIVNGVYINGIEVSGLNIEEAKEKLMRNISKQVK